MKRQINLMLVLLFLQVPLIAQVIQAPEWKVTASKEKVEIGEEVELIFRAKVPKDWYMYSSDFNPELGPMLTEFEFISNDTYELVGDLKPVGQKKKYDEIWQGEITYFTGVAEFRQTVRILKENPVIQGVVSYQICSDVTGQCIPFESDLGLNNIKVNSSGQQTLKSEEVAKPSEEGRKEIQEQFAAAGESQNPGQLKSAEEETTFIIEGAKANKERNAVEVAPYAEEEAVVTTAEGEIPVLRLEPFKNPFAEDVPKESSWQALIAFFLISFGAGFAALLTPCVFPMIPMTVTYFTKESTTRAKGIMKAAVYGISIIVIYTLIGTVFSLIFGAEFANWLSTHWIPNLFFFAVFIIFALSFFGLFEINLPSGLVNKIDKQSDKGGIIGIFFMSFTLVLVSFSCTGPIAGTILLQAANGEAIKPLVGMLGFSAAFAIPFTLLAIFPGWLNTLPKSGGWLNVAKVTLAFLELALALKFLSMADQVYHWGILDREIYIALWIVIFTLLGFYLLGKIRFPHDSETRVTSVPRLILAVLVFGFVIYLTPGLIGAPLKAMAGYLPPMATHDFNLLAVGNEEEESKLPPGFEEPKYADLLHLPHGLNGYFDYEQALAFAKAENKPLFIDFTGHGCVNCREMEAKVWSDPEVLKRLKEDYVVVALYVDEKTEVPEEEWYISAYDGKVKKTIGKQNLDFMIQRLHANAQPYYTLVDNHGELLAAPRDYEPDVQEFVEFLDKGKERFRQLELASK